MDSYSEFANLYDDLMKDFDYEEWFNYIEEIFKKYNIMPKNILEMACGTGSLSYFLGDRGYRLTCFDLSPDMLSKAYEKLRKFKNVKILKQDMVSFSLDKSFNAVVSVCDSINYITDLENLNKTFNNVWKHLDDDGIFIFDVNSYYKLKNVIGNNIFMEDRESVFYTWQNQFNENNNICSFYLTFFHSSDGVNYIRFDEEHRQRAYTVEEIISSLKKAGFSTVDYYDAFSFQSPRIDTERINFVAIK